MTFLCLSHVINWEYHMLCGKLGSWNLLNTRIFQGFIFCVCCISWYTGLYFSLNLNSKDALVSMTVLHQQLQGGTCLFLPIKLRSHMRGTIAERRQADFDIPAPLPQVCSHIRDADPGGSAISWGQRWFGARGFEADVENWVLDPFVAERILLPLLLSSATVYVWTHVMICVEANFPPASPLRMCERTFRPVMTWCWWVSSRRMQLHFISNGITFFFH